MNDKTDKYKMTLQINSLDLVKYNIQMLKRTDFKTTKTSKYFTVYFLLLYLYKTIKYITFSYTETKPS